MNGWGMEERWCVDGEDLLEPGEAGCVREGGSECLCTLNPNVVAAEAGMMGRE